jgi:hypothetical protein
MAGDNQKILLNCGFAAEKYSERKRGENPLRSLGRF